MGDGSGVSVEQVVSMLTRRRARLPFEIGAFVALEACERLLAQDPTVVQPADVRIDETGHVTVSRSGARATSAEAARAVARVLARLLVAAGHGVPRNLVQLVEQGPEGTGWDLVRLRDELEASLVPLNRAAARRVLSRVLRDAQRGGSVPSIPDLLQSGSAGADSDVDAELDALLDEGFEDRPMDRQHPAPPASPASPPSWGRVPEVEGAPAPPPGDLLVSPAAAPGASGDGPSPVDEPPLFVQEMPAGDTAVHPDGGEDVAAEPSFSPAPPEPRRPRRWAYAALALLAVLGAGLALLRLGASDGAAWRGDASGRAEDERAGAEAAQQRHSAEGPARRAGRLTVEVEPEGAQILRYVGRGPASADRLPVGQAHEFVAVARGRLPSRAVVGEDADWSQGGEGLRYELAMQTGDASRHARELELGAPKRRPPSTETRGPSGTVRIITNPPGAKVYHLVGFAPRVEMRGLDVDRAHELLVYREGHEPQRVVVGPSDWTIRDGGPPVAHLRVTLDPR